MFTRILELAPYIIIFMVGIGVFFYTLTSVLGISTVNERRVDASAASLQAAFNTVCDTGQTAEIKVNFPQEEPIGVKGVYEHYIKQNLKLNGDPKYLIYYESFPPGEGVSWESYLNLKKRAIREVKQSEDLSKYKTDSEYPFVPANIILSSLPQESTKEQIESLGKPRLYGDVGVWRNNTYQFFNLQAISNLEKTVIKYRPCGNTSLCLKTPSQIVKLPLRYCEGLKSIRMIYEEGWLWDNCKGGKCPDFHLASPCYARLEIKRVNCGNFDDNDGNCERAVEYPLYKMEDDSLKQSGSTIQCADRVYTQDADGTVNLGGQFCLQVKIKSGDGFCATSNRNVGGLLSWLLNTVKTGRTISSSDSWGDYIRNIWHGEVGSGGKATVNLVEGSGSLLYMPGSDSVMFSLEASEKLGINNLYAEGKFFESASSLFHQFDIDLAGMLWPYSKITWEEEDTS